MAVTFIGEINNFGSVNNKNESKYTRKFLLVSDDWKDGKIAVELAVVAATGITRTSHYQTETEEDTWSWAQSLSAEREGDDSLNWVVTIEYAPDENNGEKCPWLQAAAIEETFEQREQGIDYDIWGYPILNSCGEPWSEPITRQAASRVITVTQNEHYYIGAYEQYVNVVNSNACTIGAITCDKRTLLLPGIPWRRQYDATYQTNYFTYKWVLMYRPESWDKFLLDKGYRELVTVGEETYKTNICVGGHPTSVPALLDGAGHALPRDSVEYYWFRKQVYPEVPFIFSFRS